MHAKVLCGAFKLACTSWHDLVLPWLYAYYFLLTATFIFRAAEEKLRIMGLFGRIRLMSRLQDKLLMDTLEEYIEEKTGKMPTLAKAAALSAAELAFPGIASFIFMLTSSIWTMLDMMERLGMMEGCMVWVQCASLGLIDKHARHSEPKAD
eukprot:1157799-Pelagomonas_calceolata.AAC.2